jgi:hypothetical protein
MARSLRLRANFFFNSQQRSGEKEKVRLPDCMLGSRLAVAMRPAGFGG